MRQILIVSFVLITTVSFGQTKDCDCSPNLNRDLKDKLTITHYNEFKDWLYEYFQKDETTRSSMKRNDRANWSGKFSAVIDGLPLTGNSSADWASSRNNQKFHKIEQTTIQNKYLTEEQFDQVLEEKFGANQLVGYMACLDLCKSVMGNGVSYVTGGDLQDEFFIQIIFNSTSGGKLMLKGPAIYSNLEPIGGSIFKDSLIVNDRQSVTQYFKRITPEKAASFNINSNIVTNPIVFDGIIPVNQQAIPIGTIVCSVLDYNSFLKANGLDKMENEKMEKVLWIPCDGRRESKSKYSSYSGGNIPDLRGVFLRGINDYRVNFPTVVPVSQNQKNPDNKVANSFQDDAFQGHRHSMDGNGAPGIYKSYEKGSGTYERGSEPSYKDARPFIVRDPIADDLNGSPKISSETRPKNVTVYYYIKVN